MIDGPNGLILPSMSSTRFLTFSERELAWYVSRLVLLADLFNEARRLRMGIARARTVERVNKPSRE